MMVSFPAETTRPSGYAPAGGMKASALMNELDWTAIVSWYVGGCEAAKDHCRTVPSREAEKMTLDEGKTTART